MKRFIFFCFLYSWLVSASSCRENSSPVFPLKVSDNGRYLVDQEEAPFFIQADTPWSLFVATTKTEAETYLENRRQKGFNALTVNLIEHWFKGDSMAYPFASINVEGNSPFAANLYDKVPDFSRPNDAYFDHVDHVIGKALEKGILIMMTPAYMGYIGLQEGWYAEVLANGKDRCRAYGRYLGRRYVKFPNIVWIMDGDRNPDSLSAPLEREIVAGIKEFDTLHLFTAHCHPTFSSRDQWEGEPWLDLNAVYTYNWLDSGSWVHQKCQSNYRRNPVMPAFLFETAYEGEHKYSPFQIRAEMYWGWLCSIGGQQMGNRPIWMFGSGWQAAMDGQASKDAAQLKKLVDSRPWHELEPDFDHQFVTEGYGSDDKYIASALTPDGRTGIIYVPEGGASFQVDLSKISGTQAIVWWFNPGDGEAILAGKYAVKGRQAFQKPDGQDWVMVIDDVNAGFGIPAK